MNLLLICSLVSALLLGFSGQAARASTTITHFIPGPSSVGRYEKYEATFSISRTFPEMPDFAYPDRYEQAFQAMLPYYYYDPADTPARDPNRRSPYGVDGISIDALITAPSGRRISLPAFYYQDFTRSRRGGAEVLSPTGKPAWKIRFAPDELGTYTYSLRIQDRFGRWQSPTHTFRSVPSDSPGFIRVSPRDNRFLEYSSGASFIPISAGQQWWAGSGKSYDYEAAFQQFGQHGVNFTRIWDQNDGFALTVEGRFDATRYPDDFRPTDNAEKYNDPKYKTENLAKGTQMNQRGNFQQDKIIEAAEKNGVSIQLSSHGDAYWIWDASVYEHPDGSGIEPGDPRHLDYWKRNFRYRVARWGYSTAILAWEHWNELGHVLPDSAWYNFYQAYAPYQRATDPYRHLLTTSQNSQAYSPGLWSSPAMDVVSYHDYLDERYAGQPFAGDNAEMVYRFAQCLRHHASVDCGLGLGDGSRWTGADKPILWTEWDYYPGGGFNRIADHNAMWAGLFSPIGMTPTDWYFNEKPYAAAKLDLLKVASDFFADVDYAGERFAYAATADVRIAGIPTGHIEASSGGMRVLGMRNAARNRAYLWAQNKQYTVAGSANPAPVAGSVTLTQMRNGMYRLEYWDTTSGAVTTASVAVTGDRLTLPIAGLAQSVAIKAIFASPLPHGLAPAFR